MSLKGLLHSRIKICTRILVEFTLINIFFYPNLDHIHNFYKTLFTLIWCFIGYILGIYHINLKSVKSLLTYLKQLTFHLLLFTFLSILILLLSGLLNENNFHILLLNVLIFSFLSIVNNIFTSCILKYLMNRGQWLFFDKQNSLDLLLNFYVRKLQKSKKIRMIDNLEMLNCSSNNQIDGLIIEDKDLKKFNKKDILQNNIYINKLSQVFERFIFCIPPELVNYNNEELDFSISKYHYKFPYKIIKRFGDLTLSLMILFLSSPIILISSLLIYLEDNGPIFYSQERSGLNKKIIKIYKLRTMYKNAEKKGAQWSTRNDPRITKIGGFLRKTRLDELPQLVTVIKGDMSLIGPRPERPELEKRITKEVPNYDLKFKMIPGLSGWAQVNYPYGASINDTNIKLSYDIFYLFNKSLMVDLLILFKTIRLIFNAKGAIPKNNSTDDID